MSIKVDRRFIENTLKYWGDDKTDALLEAMRVELRRDLRKCSKNEAPIVESIIEQMGTEEFWEMLNWVTEYQFNP